MTIFINWFSKTQKAVKLFCENNALSSKILSRIGYAFLEIQINQKIYLSRDKIVAQKKYL